MKALRVMLGAGLVAGALAVRPVLAAEVGRQPAQIGGSFLQLWDDHRSWSATDWAELFGYFQALGLKELVVQWVERGDAGYFAAQNEIILDLADRGDMRVWVGLTDDPQFWQKIRRDPELLEVYFKRRELRTAEVLEALAARVQLHASFAGWYVADEVDDVHWLDAARQAALVRYLNDVGARLRAVAPGSRIAISGFTNAFVDPRALGELWQALFAATPIDLVLFQDGIGVGKLELDTLPLYLDAVRGAVSAQSRDWRVVIEIFQQTEGEPVTDQPFAAQPAPLERIRKQLEIASGYSSAAPLAFSVPEYLTPRGGEKAGALYERYRAGRPR